MIGLQTGVNTVAAEADRERPWGEFETWTAAGITDTLRLRWKGLLYEGDSTQLYYMRARWYDPVTHRFYSQDPIGLDGGINPYVFAANDPVNASDPKGTDLCPRDKMGCPGGNRGYGGGGGGLWSAIDWEGQALHDWVTENLSEWTYNSADTRDPSADTFGKLTQHTATGWEDTMKGCPTPIYQRVDGIHGPEFWYMNKVPNPKSIPDKLRGLDVGIYGGFYSAHKWPGLQFPATGWILCSRTFFSFTTNHP